eukprot:Platyproteum_vivax@DN4092_c0_g1_i1.p1
MNCLVGVNSGGSAISEIVHFRAYESEDELEQEALPIEIYTEKLVAEDPPDRLLERRGILKHVVLQEVTVEVAEMVSQKSFEKFEGNKRRGSVSIDTIATMTSMETYQDFASSNSIVFEDAPKKESVVKNVQFASIEVKPSEDCGMYMFDVSKLNSGGSPRKGIMNKIETATRETPSPKQPGFVNTLDIYNLGEGKSVQSSLIMNSKALEAEACAAVAVSERNASPNGSFFRKKQPKTPQTPARTTADGKKKSIFQVLFGKRKSKSPEPQTPSPKDANKNHTGENQARTHTESSFRETANESKPGSPPRTDRHRRRHETQPAAPPSHSRNASSPHHRNTRSMRMPSPSASPSSTSSGEKKWKAACQDGHRGTVPPKRKSPDISPHRREHTSETPSTNDSKKHRSPKHTQPPHGVSGPQSPDRQSSLLETNFSNKSYSAPGLSKAPSHAKSKLSNSSSPKGSISGARNITPEEAGSLKILSNKFTTFVEKARHKSDPEPTRRSYYQMHSVKT